MKISILPKISRKEIEDQNEKGRVVAIFQQKYVLDLTEWIKVHPGGKNTIMFMRGKDITDTLHAFHPPYVWQEKYQSFIIGELMETAEDQRVSDKDLQISRAYQELDIQLRNEGFYEPDYQYYLNQGVWMVLIWAAAVYVLLTYPGNIFAILLSAVLLGILWHGVGFILHDVGHHSILCGRKSDDYLGYFLASFVNGISMSWQQHHHNTHHATTNHIEHDPDIQMFPLWAVNEKFFNNIYSTYRENIMKFTPFVKFMVSIQTWTLVPIFFTISRLGMQAGTLEHIREMIFKRNYKHRLRLFLEVVMIVGHYTWFLYILAYLCIPEWWQRIVFYIVSNMSSGLYFWQISTSHFAMPTEEVANEEIFAKRNCRVTNNVECPAWLDWFFGGFHFQIEHHFFPKNPRSNLRRLSPIIQDFCRQHNLQYNICSFFEAYRQTMVVFADIATKAKFHGQ